MKWLTILVLTATALASCHFTVRDSANKQYELQIARYAATERPLLDHMCSSYFEWSSKYNERVKGMEDQCTTKLIVRPER